MSPKLTESCLSESASIKELLDSHPYLLSTFVDLGLMCVGCPADAFHSLADVAREYKLEGKELVARLQAVINDNMA